MQARSTSKKLLYWGIFLLMFTLVPLLLLELSARAFMHFKHGKPGKSYGLWQADAELGAIHAFNSYNSNAETNDHGFRNVENVLEPKPDGALRVIAYGGSTTFCYNLFNGEDWPAILQNHLRKNHHPQDQVLNAGAISWALGHAYLRARREIPALKPDFVLIYAGLNEHTNVHFAELEGKNLKELLAQGRHNAIATNYDQASWAKRSLVSMRFIEYLISPVLEKMAKSKRTEIAEQQRSQIDSTDAFWKPKPEVLENYRLVLRDFIQLAKDNGAQPVFIIEAHDRQHVENHYFTSYSRGGAALAESMGVPVFDAQKMVDAHPGKPTDLFIATGAHYTKLGAERFGEWLFKNVFEKPDTATAAPADSTGVSTQ